MALASPLAGQTTYTWIVGGPDADFNRSANWVAGPNPPVPATSSHAALFPFHVSSTPESVVLPAGSLSLDSLRFEPYPFSLYSTTNYSFSSAGATTLTLANGLTKAGDAPQNPVRTTFAAGISFDLATPQTWNLTHVAVDGSISGPGKLTFNPSFNPSGAYPSTYGPGFRPAYLTLMGDNNFAGGLEVQNAELQVGHAGALDGSSLRLLNADLRALIDTTLTTPLRVSGSVQLAADPSHTLTIGSTTTLEGSVHLIGGGVTFNGTIAEDAPNSSLTLTGAATFAGDNSTSSYTGGTILNEYARLHLTNAIAVPANGAISSHETAYVGIRDTAGIQAGLVSRLDGTNFHGTLGLDSPNPESPLNFSSALDLSALLDFRGLGTSSAAILSGPLTIAPEQDYRFGGGGGYLGVVSPLTNAGSKLILDDPAITGDPLTVQLQGTNTFAGGIEVRHGVLVFDGSDALPGTGMVSFNSDNRFGYAGYTETAALTPGQFLARFDTNTLHGLNVVGIDSANPAEPRTVAEPVDLSLLNTHVNSYYLGTSTRVTLTGTVTPVAGGHLALAGVKGGWITLEAPLDPTVTHLTVGIPDSAGTVELNGPSQHHSGTTLQSGTLLLGDAQALGHGAVVVTAPETRIAATTDLTLHNSIYLGEGGAGLTFGTPGSPADLTLAGAVYTNDLTYVGAGMLTLAGLVGIWDQLNVAATGGGGVVISGDTLYYYSQRVKLDSGSLTYNARRAWVHGIESAHNAPVVLGPGANLWLYGEPSEGTVDTTYANAFSGPGSLTFDDYVDITLTGNNSYSGGTTFTGSGSVLLGNNSALGTGQLVFDGYGFTLQAFAGSISLANPMELRGDDDDDDPEDFDEDGSVEIEGPFDLDLTGMISGRGGVKKDGTGTARLSAANTFTGHIELEDGVLEFAHDNAAGIGRLIFDADSALAKAVFLTPAPQIFGLESEYWNAGSGVELAPESTLTIDQNHYSEFWGPISGEGASLTKAGYGGLVLFGENTYSGGTHVTGGGVIFGELDAFLDGGNLTTGTGGYIGLAASIADVDTFLDKFDRPATHGTIGFDSDPYVGPYVVNGAVDLSGFAADARLGSASHARLAPGALITPAVAGTYRFGGGGGLLEIDSPLVDQSGPASVVVESPEVAPLTLRLMSGDNTFSGGVTATHSAVIFGLGALPATGSFTLGPGGYIGSEDEDLSISSFLGRFAAATGGIIGFDQAPEATAPRTITDPINLAGFSGDVYLGTTHPGIEVAGVLNGGVRLAGEITPAGSTYRFAGYKSGVLEVASTLTGARSVAVGDPDTIATFGDPTRSIAEHEEILATVLLTGTNDHTGDTTLYGGRLVLGSATALGAATNTLIVNSMPLPPGLSEGHPLLTELAFRDSSYSLANPIVLNSSLAINTGWELTLNGAISGPGGLRFGDDTNVTLGGENSFTGGVRLDDYVDVTVLTNSGLGSGILSFGEDGGTVIFESPAPVIGGLRAEFDYYDAEIYFANDSVLTIDQEEDSVFRGYIESNSEHATGLVKTGTGNLRLESTSYGISGFDGGDDVIISADIQQGTITIGEDAYDPLGSAVVRLSGGTLALDYDAYLDNPLQLNSGRLTGHGMFENYTSSTGFNAVGPGVILAPGSSASPIGTLTFDELTLAGGGTLEWQIQSLGNGAFATDLLSISGSDTLTITATSGNRFNLKLATLGQDGSSGLLAGLATGTTYSWVLIDTVSLEGFDPNAFAIDAAQFFSDVGPGTFSVRALSLSGGYFNQIMLDFTPVPEPSTWVLLLAGAGCFALTTLRRRRRASRTNPPDGPTVARQHPLSRRLPRRSAR